MKNLSIAFVFATTLFSAQFISAATTTIYRIKAHSCFGVDGTKPLYDARWGVRGETGITVNCPIMLPKQNYTSVKVTITGYQRTYNGLRPTITASDIYGGQFVYSIIQFPLIQAAAQVASTTLQLNGASTLPNHFLNIGASLAGGDTYLTAIEVAATY